MPKSTLAGPPLRPMSIADRAALVPFDFFTDAVYRSAGKEAYSNVACRSQMGDLVGGLVSLRQLVELTWAADRAMHIALSRKAMMAPTASPHLH